ISTAQSEDRFDRNLLEFRRRIHGCTTAVSTATTPPTGRDCIPFPHFRTDFVCGCYHSLYYKSVVANIKYPPFLGLPDVGSQGAGERASPGVFRPLRGTDSQHPPRPRI